MRKILLFLAAFGLAACNHTIPVLTSSSKVVTKTLSDGTVVKCGRIQEWDIGEVRNDDKKFGCWCMMAPRYVFPPGGYIVVFALGKDNMCEE